LKFVLGKHPRRVLEKQKCLCPFFPRLFTVNGVWLHRLLLGRKEIAKDIPVA
jgi:hypothetical protein